MKNFLFISIFAVSFYGCSIFNANKDETDYETHGGGFVLVDFYGRVHEVDGHIKISPSPDSLIAHLESEPVNRRWYHIEYIDTRESSDPEMNKKIPTQYLKHERKKQLLIWMIEETDSALTKTDSTTSPELYESLLFGKNKLEKQLRWFK